MEAKDRLKEIRKELEMTQAEFAERLGMKWHRVKDLESGRLKVTEDVAVKLSRTCGINFKWVLYGEEPKTLLFQEGDILATVDAGQFIDLYDTEMSGKLAKAFGHLGESPPTISTLATDELASSEIIMTVRFIRARSLEAVFKRADGICEICHEKAPFNRASNNMPYLEVHHISPVSLEDDDTFNNLLAVCPNCHRRLHYG